ncbi:hypothetical protein [Blastochloris viridis]|nr:hypothetical protein [Blastochloris viridis]BAR99935.1 hypothetical protein BV133_2342 [Blastochloris viridis]
MPSPPPEELARLRALYETRRDVTVAELAAECGLPASRLKRYASRYGWYRRRLPNGLRRRAGQGAGRHRGFLCTGFATCREREAMVGKLFAACEDQVAAAVDRLAAGGDDLVPEREARTLAVLARTIERLAAIDSKRAAAGGPDDRSLPKDYAGLRAELARRLAELEAEGAGGGVAGAADRGRA